MKNTVLKDNEIKFWEFLKTAPKIVHELVAKNVVQEIEIVDNVIVFKGLVKSFRVIKLSDSAIAILPVL